MSQQPAPYSQPPIGNDGRFVPMWLSWFERLLQVGDIVVTAITLSSTGVVIRSGSASPAGVIPANPGSLYLQGDGVNGKLWVKETGTGNTGWVAK